MLSQLKSYLFGANDGVMLQSSTNEACIVASVGRVDEEDWVLVDTQADGITELPGVEEEAGLTSAADLEESWIVTQDDSTTLIAGMNHSSKARRGHGQPKGTKPRRWRTRKNSTSSNTNPATSVEEDAESTSSSIAIVPSPEPVARPAITSAAASAVLASSADAKQVAAIASARSAKVKVEKTWMSRNNLLRGNQTAMAASGRNNRRSHLIASRLCGSNNNRKSHQF